MHFKTGSGTAFAARPHHCTIFPSADKYFAPPYDRNAPICNDGCTKKTGMQAAAGCRNFQLLFEDIEIIVR